MDEDQKLRNELYSKYREDVLKRQLSNTENYDKAVLSLGTTFLGFSLGFLKDFVPYKLALCAFLLPASWIFFCISIVATIISFFVSQKGLSTQLKYAEQYYVYNDESYLTKKNHAADLTDKVNIGSAILFILAIITTISFVIINLENGANMSQKKISFTTDGASIPVIPQLMVKGANVPNMQPLTSSTSTAALGAQIPAMQLAPAPTTSQSSTSSSGGCSPGANGKTTNGQ